MSDQDSAEQMSLPLGPKYEPIIKPKYERGLSTLERFKEFHALNPHVARYLAMKALDLQRKGIQKWGVQALFVVLRYDYTLSVTSGDFKISNSFSPYYSRLLMKHVPKLVDFFDVSELKDGEPDL